MNPKRIVLAIHSLRGGGAERLMSLLANHWVTNHQVTLITWSSEDDQYPIDERVVRSGLNLQKHSHGLLHGLIANWRRVHRLREKLRDNSPDLIVSFCDQMNIVCLEAARGLPTIPVWIAEHSDPAQQRLSRFWEGWRSRNYHRCSGAVALTEEIAETMSRWIPIERIRVIPPAMVKMPGSDDVYQEVSPHTFNTMLYVGRLSAEKQLDLLLQAWRRIQPQLPNWQLKIVGDGPERMELERLGQEAGNVVFTGWTDQPENFYRQSQMFVMCSRYEGFPVALLEALSFGLPSVVTSCSSAIDRLRSSAGTQAIASVPVNSAESLATAILQVASDPELRKRMSSTARRLAAAHTWDHIGPLWDEILE